MGQDQLRDLQQVAEQQSCNEDQIPALSQDNSLRLQEMLLERRIFLATPGSEGFNVDHVDLPVVATDTTCGRRRLPAS